MALPIPNLDDRRFQDLVDEAKRLVQQRCPEWTDHNVSDPGVTLIEAFATMTDQLLYRLNRVPDRNYLKYLELIGVRLFPPTAARTAVTFWLAAPQPEAVTIPEGTQAATVRTQSNRAIVFSTLEPVTIPAVSLARAASIITGGEVRNHTDALAMRTGFFCFDKVPKVGDVLLVGLSDAAPACAVTLQFSCRIEGVGVDPEFPPLSWEAWDGDAWAACEVDRDGTGGLNRDGDLVLHLPRHHATSIIDRVRAGWLRARAVESVEGQPAYSASPEIISLSAFAIGGTAEAINAEQIENEELGNADGTAGASFLVRQRPVVSTESPEVVETGGENGWQEWTEVPNFAASSSDDRHFVLDGVAGEVQFGPAVRLPDGSIRNYGAVPPAGAPIRIRAYRTGGGIKGNVAARALSVLKSSIPYVSRIENRRSAEGGVDGEDIESAKIRGPVLLRTRDRAVTAEDFEQLAKEAAPEIARVHCVAAAEAADAGSVRVLVVPNVVGQNGRIRFEQLVPAEQTLEKVTHRLDECRLIGTRVMVEPPVYRGITVVARLRARSHTDPVRLEQAALDALYAYFHPTEGGPDGGGWPFGRPVTAGEVYSALSRVRGTELVDDVKLFGADPTTGQRGKATDRLDVEPHALVFSYEHQVMVETA